MHRAFWLAAIAALSITGCGEDSPGPAQAPVSGDPPGLSSPPAVAPLPPPMPPLEAEEVPPAAEPFAVDLERRMVRLPDRGWVSSEEFWDIYYHRPQELPGDLDHEALAALRAREAP